jgi:hypothetical protein
VKINGREMKEVDKLVYLENVEKNGKIQNEIN